MSLEPISKGTYWKPENLVLPDYIVVRALAEGDVSFSPREFHEGRRGFCISRDAMMGAAPCHRKMVELAWKHIGSGTRESHPVLSFTRDPLTACFFAKGLQTGRNSAKQLVFIDLRDVGPYLDVSNDSRCAQHGITGRQRRWAAAAAEVLIFQPITSVISFVDVTPIFVNKVGQALAKAKTARDFKTRISSAQQSCVNGILRTVLRLVDAKRSSVQPGWHGGSRPTKRKIELHDQRIAATPMRTTFTLMGDRRVKTGMTLCYSCLQCGSIVPEADLASHLQTATHRAASATLPRINVRHVKVHTTEVDGWVTTRDFEHVPAVGQIVQRNMTVDKGQISPRYHVAYADGFVDTDLSESQIATQRSNWRQGTSRYFVAWIRGAKVAAASRAAQASRKRDLLALETARKRHLLAIHAHSFHQKRKRDQAQRVVEYQEHVKRLRHMRVSGGQIMSYDVTDHLRKRKTFT